MYVITFYSFKGGVGRTMALANIAAELVRRGRKVLVVDFDLEAPGLETYKHLRPQQPHPGIVEYVTEFRRTYAVPKLLDYIYETKPIGKKGGRLWVMPAGRRDRAYRNALVALDWKRLYKDEAGFLLFEDTKKGWEEELKPDYVLIDSRTGDTDVLGICTRQLPDSVVLMFMPNEQNLAGLENVCRDIRREETEGLKKKIRLHFVAANVPDLDDEKRILRRQIDTFRKRLDFKDLSGMIRRYENLALLDQSIFTLDHPHSRLAYTYKRLLRTLLKDNLADREGALLFLQNYPEYLETRIVSNDGGHPRLTMSMQGTVFVPNPENPTGPYIPSVPQSEDKNRLLEIARHFSCDAEVLTKVAECFILEEDFKSAIQTLDRVLQLEPNRANALLHRVGCNLNLADIDGAVADLLAYLRLPAPQGGPLTAFKFSGLKGGSLQKLRDIAPAKLFDVAEMLETAALPGVDPHLVASFLCDTEEGALRAVRLLRKTKNSVPAKILLLAHCWTEVIQLHERGILEEARVGSMFELALAHWGKDGEMPEPLCKQALEALEGDDQFLHIWGPQALALLLWRTGDVVEAMEWLIKAEQRARADADDSFSHTLKEDKVFSMWRLRTVSIGQYLDDCQLLRRMIQGEPIRPAFLGEPGGLHANDSAQTR